MKIVIVRCINELEEGLFIKGVIYEVVYTNSGSFGDYSVIIDGEGNEILIETKAEFEKHFKLITL